MFTFIWMNSICLVMIYWGVFTSWATYFVWFYANCLYIFLQVVVTIWFEPRKVNIAIILMTLSFWTVLGLGLYFYGW